jgi:condensation domain-containing protein
VTRTPGGGPAHSPLPFPVRRLRILAQTVARRRGAGPPASLLGQSRFDLTRAPLIRATLVRLAPEEHVLVLTMPQLVCDGWSNGIFCRELATLYDTWP